MLLSGLVGRTASLSMLSLAFGSMFGGAAAIAQSPPGVPCSSVSVLAVWATPASPLVVSVNGVNIGSYDGSISLTLDGFLKPGVNEIRFSYPAVAKASTEAALKCRPPGADSKATILLLRPSAAKLSDQAYVEFVKP
jgi:hypothetical protein